MTVSYTRYWLFCGGLRQYRRHSHLRQSRLRAPRRGWVLYRYLRVDGSLLDGEAQRMVVDHTWVTPRQLRSELKNQKTCGASSENSSPVRSSRLPSPESPFSTTGRTRAISPSESCSPSSGSSPSSTLTSGSNGPIEAWTDQDTAELAACGRLLEGDGAILPGRRLQRAATVIASLCEELERARIVIIQFLAQGCGFPDPTNVRTECSEPLHMEARRALSEAKEGKP